MVTRESTTESTETTTAYVTPSTEATTDYTTTVRKTTTTTKPSPSGGCDCSSRPGDCWCIGTRTPNELSANQTPKMVMITFDDAVTDLNFDVYTELFDGRTNPNGCPISTTYFVSGIYTNYERVRNLFAKG